MMDIHLLILLQASRKFDKSKIQPYRQEFKENNSWLHKLGLGLVRRTSTSQNLPKHVKEKLSRFHEMCAKFLKIRKYALAPVGNMDEMAFVFNIVYNKPFANRGPKLVTKRAFGFEKKT